MTWLLPDDVARICRVSRRTIERWCHDRRIPHVRVGRNLRFTQEQVRQIVEEYSVEPRDGVEVDIPNPDFDTHRAVVVPMEPQRKEVS